MRYACSWILLLLSAVIQGAGSQRPADPIAMDWHPGGRLYVLYETGEVVAYDNQGRLLSTLQGSYGFRPAEIVSARVHGQEVIFVSGFSGRQGTIIEYSGDGRLLQKYSTPQLAAGVDIDPGTGAPKHADILYVASAVSSDVYSINLNEPSREPTQLAYIKGAKSLGPVVFDRSHNRLFIGDEAEGDLYEVDCETGKFTVAATDLGRPISLALDSTSHLLYVADYSSGRISVLKIGEAGQRLSRSTSMSTGLEKLIAIALAPDNSLYVADLRKGVFQFSKAGLKVLVSNTPD
jgi:DNA-binding beta-propeller fold protein YncE